VIEEIRIALGSVAPVPLRLTEVERMVSGKTVDPELVREAKKAVAAAIRPIDDIRSTARYRGAVTANLVAEFLEQLRATGKAA
jgi:CO/xanthine dehydrogenase FAD-binding subunit